MKRYNNLGACRRAGRECNLTERHFRLIAGRYNEDKTAKANAIYAQFELLEEQLARCYFLLRDRFLINPELARFWTEAGLDETERCSILRYCREHRLFTDRLEVAEAAARVDDLLETVKGIVEDPNVTADDAFYASLLMESSELSDVYENLTRPLANNHAVLYATIQAGFRARRHNFAAGAAQFTQDKGYVEAFENIGRHFKQTAGGRTCS